MIYRAIFKSGPPLTSPDGEPTRGTYYFCRMMRALVRDRRPDYLAVAMDSDRWTYARRRRFPAYKSNREQHSRADKEVAVQLARIKEVLAAWGVPTIEVAHWEADDVIATLAHRHSIECRVVVVSRDKDLHQVVDENVIVHDPQAGEWWGPADVEARWGVPPHRVLDVQTLAGDTTDKVPGVRGVGEKTASALIQRYGSLEAVRRLPLDIPKKIRRHIQETDLDLQRYLVELRTDLDVDVTLEDLAFRGLNHRRAGAVFRRLGIRRWA